MMFTTNRFVAIAVLLIALSGCGRSGPNLIDIHGVVTLEGKPVNESLVEFIPDTGRPSHAVTDADGKYNLIYTQSQKGAITGQHTVKISTARESIAVEGKLVQKAVRESIPKQYNEQSQLKLEVDGSTTTYNFDLKKDGSTTGPS